MSIFTSAQAFQQTRHARRLYVGGIPPNYTDEEELKAFLNLAIATGLGEENDNSFVLSIYINQKKWFAFIELRSIELATACLAMDGLIFKKVALKVLRANEYKPELIPPSLIGKPITLDLSSFSFGNTMQQSSRPPSHDSKWLENKDSMTKFTFLPNVETGSVVVVGFPFDGSNQRDSLPKVSAAPASTNVLTTKGCTAAPRAFRQQLKKPKFSLENPEFDINLGMVKMLDVGDVVSGKTSEETAGYLSTIIQEVVKLGGLPFVVGGSHDMFAATTNGLTRVLSSHGLGLSLLTISAHMRDITAAEGNNSLLDDPSLTHVRFAAQGALCSRNISAQVLDGHGRIVWLSKDLRTGNRDSQRTQRIFQDSLDFAKQDKKPVVVALDMSAACSSVGGASLASNSPSGLTVDEILDIAFSAGADPHVICFQVADFHPTTEDTRDNWLLSELFYRFSLGVASRSQSFALPLSPSALNLSMAGSNSAATSSTAHPAAELLSFAVYLSAVQSANSSPAHLLPQPPSSASSVSSSQVPSISGLDSNRSSANISQTSAQYATPASIDRMSMRLLSHAPNPPGRPPSLSGTGPSLSGLEVMGGGAAAGEASGRTSVRLSMNSVALSEDGSVGLLSAPTSRPNSLNAYPPSPHYSEAMLQLTGGHDGLDGVDASSKHYGRKLDPLKVDAYMDPYTVAYGAAGLLSQSTPPPPPPSGTPSASSFSSATSVCAPGSAIPSSSHPSMLGDTDPHGSNANSFYSMASFGHGHTTPSASSASSSYEHRRSGLRFSSSQLGVLAHTPSASQFPSQYPPSTNPLSMRRTYSNTSTASDPDVEPYFTPPSSYTGGPNLMSFAAMDALGGGEPDLLPGLRGLLSSGGNDSASLGLSIPNPIKTPMHNSAGHGNPLWRR